MEIELVLSNFCFYLPASRLSIARGMFSISMHTQSPLLPHQIFQTDGQAREILLVFKYLPSPPLPGVMCPISIIPRVNGVFQLGNGGLHEGMLVCTRECWFKRQLSAFLSLTQLREIIVCNFTTSSHRLRELIERLCFWL